MQTEVVYRKPQGMSRTSGVSSKSRMSQRTSSRQSRAKERTSSGRNKDGRRGDSRETIHSGHFMVSDFEAEAQDDEDELAVPVPEEETAVARLPMNVSPGPGLALGRFLSESVSSKTSSQQLSIETSLNKLFQCMSLAYRQKLTSPKWNRFKGIRLRWKDKIRLNNVIWRCWHMQFILKQNTLVCQFASPLDVDTHNKPEAVVLEGKYWKRKLAAVTAEYKKWRMFYRNKILGWTNKDGIEMLESMDVLDWNSNAGCVGNYGTNSGNAFGGVSGSSGGDSMMVDEDYMELMTDTLFSTISSNQPLYFPDPREIARGASLADFIQPSLGPLQPNLDDFMDTLEPLQEFLNSKLPPVPEEDDMFRSNALNDLDLIAPMAQLSELANEARVKNEQSMQQHALPSPEEHRNVLQNIQYTNKMYSQQQLTGSGPYRNTLNVNDNYGLVQQNYEPPTTQPIREKSRQSRSTTRSNRVIQQTQQRPQHHQQNAFSQIMDQQTSSYAQQPQQQYSMDMQTVQLSQVNPNQVQIATLNDQPVNSNHIPIVSHVQNVVTLPQSFNQQSGSSLQMHQKTIRNLPTATTKPYKIVDTEQRYKFLTPTESFDVQQCKFTTNNYKAVPVHQIVPISSNQPDQSQLLLQCGTSGLDLTTPALHPTKLLPQPVTTIGTSKEEVFAVPKYQMKARTRSRSSSALAPPRMHPSPPLISTVSDPALNINNNVLLAQLLTNNTSGLYPINTTTEKAVSSTNQPTTVKHILPILSASVSSTQVTNTVNPITCPVTVQSIQLPTVQSQSQQQSMAQQNCNPQILLSTQNQIHQHQANSSSPKDCSGAQSPQSINLSPLNSPMSLGSPLSPPRNYIKSVNDSLSSSSTSTSMPERGQYKEQRRVGHIHAEQKRRYNIKNGFDTLHNLIPQLSQNPNSKLSKAAMLQKGADFVKQLQAERHQLKEEVESLKQQIDCLNTSISNCQSMLPATGAPVSRHKTSKMKEMFDEYVRTRTRENWKFWIFSILLEPLLISFNTSVSTASIEDLYRTTLLWVEQHCSLVDLRPAVLNALRYLCTATDILTNPSRLPEEALAAVNRAEIHRSTQ